VLGVAGDIHTHAVNREDVAVVPALRMILFAILGQVVRWYRLDLDFTDRRIFAVGDCSGLGLHILGKLLKHSGIDDKLGIGAKDRRKRLRIEMVAMLMRDQHETCWRLSFIE